MDFIRDVNPVLSKVGCNAGTCHGSKEGKNGFKLSLRGYDPIHGRARIRRRSRVTPRQRCLARRQPDAVEAHRRGAARRRPEVRSRATSITASARLDRRRREAQSRKRRASRRSKSSPRIRSSKPSAPNSRCAWSRRYTDGETRDVTAEAFIDSGNREVAAADTPGSSARCAVAKRPCWRATKAITPPPP